MSRGSPNPDEEATATPTNNDYDDEAVAKKARDEYALNPIGSGSSGKSSHTKVGHLRLASGSTDVDINDLGAVANRSQEELENASIENGDRGSITYKVYKRRWFGLVQITLLNIIVSWDVSYCLTYSFYVASTIHSLQSEGLRDLPIDRCYVAYLSVITLSFIFPCIPASPWQNAVP